jgi:hypothetical protein
MRRADRIHAVIFIATAVSAASRMVRKRSNRVGDAILPLFFR